MSPEIQKIGNVHQKVFTKASIFKKYAAILQLYTLYRVFEIRGSALGSGVILYK